jgi:hypothetical protein
LAFIIHSSSIEDASAMGLYLSSADQDCLENFTSHLHDARPAVTDVLKIYPKALIALDELVISLISHHAPASSGGHAPHILDCFLIGLSLNKSALWNPSTTLAPVLRDLQWLYQAFVLVRVFSKMENSPTIAFV